MTESLASGSGCLYEKTLKAGRGAREEVLSGAFDGDRGAGGLRGLGVTLPFHCTAPHPVLVPSVTLEYEDQLVHTIR